jgi:Tol biopolymer transport system component
VTAKSRRSLRAIACRLCIVALLAFTVAACSGEESNGELSGGFPSASRDGKWLAFSGDGIYVARLGKAAARITDPGNDIDAFPGWSPDGSRIVFARSGGAQFDPWVLYVVNRDGSRLRRLTEGGDAFGERAPSWSPDGEKIAFERFGLVTNVYTIDVDGTNESLLLRDAGEPAWSPDGSKIAFVRGLGDAIAVFDLETKSIERVVRSELGMASDPAWSPDGTRIAFADTPIGFPEIYVVNVDGSGLRQLTWHVEDDQSPTWTPGGRIIFASLRDGSSRLYAMNGDGTGVQPLSIVSANPG